MSNKIIEQIRKMNLDCVIEKSLDERIEEIKTKYGVASIEEMKNLFKGRYERININMKELKPCPFCGKIESVRVRIYPNKDISEVEKYSVVCDHVHGGCGSESGHYKNAEDAVKYWNQRK